MTFSLWASNQTCISNLRITIFSRPRPLQSRSVLMEEVPYRIVKLEQERVPFTDRGGRSADCFFVKLAASRAIGTRPGPEYPYTWDSPITDVTKHCWMNLPGIQKIESYRAKCKTYFVDFLLASTIPQREHASFIADLFRVIDAASSPDFPINLDIWDMTLLVPVQTRRVPATRESIQGLEKVRLGGVEDACSICLVDYDDQEQMVTRLPCSHYYHQDCILQWLHINHLCPMCRFAMPT